MKIVIVGASFAGVTAAFSARKKYPKATILLIEKQETIGFIPSGVHLVLKKEIASLEESHFVSEASLNGKDIDLLLKGNVTDIVPEEHIVVVETENEVQRIPYDKLILATGSEQNSRYIAGMDNKKIIRHKTLKQAKKALEIIGNSKNISIIGGGQLGVEMANSLVNQKKKVQLFETMDWLLLKYFDREMTEPLINRMKEQGVELFLNETVESIETLDDDLAITTQRRRIRIDAAVFALSVMPSLSFLPESIRRHEDNTIYVDRYLQTSEADVFAIGDCIQIPYSLSDESFYISLVNNAVRAGLVVVENLERQSMAFVGTVRTIGTHVFGYYLASTGMTEEESVFFDEEIAVFHTSQPATLFNSDQKTHGKIIYNVKTRKVLGGQLVSDVNILEKINVMALAVQAGITVEQLAQKDFFFHPSFTMPVDITNQLGFVEK